MVDSVIFDLDGTLWAVSYTHLDVYKRQQHPVIVGIVLVHIPDVPQDLAADGQSGHGSGALLAALPILHRPSQVDDGCVQPAKHAVPADNQHIGAAGADAQRAVVIYAQGTLGVRPPENLGCLLYTSRCV